MCGRSELVMQFQIYKRFHVMVAFVYTYIRAANLCENSPVVYFVCLVAVGVGECFVWNGNGQTVLFG